ncbi:MAG: hypothetical protein WD116_02785 [Chloroflexota bacterium]
MTGPWVVAIALAIIVLTLIVVAAGKRSPRDGGSTTGHYDPNAIGSYTLDPATMAYRLDLPTRPESDGPVTPRGAPPRRRRRRPRPTDPEDA